MSPDTNSHPNIEIGNEFKCQKLVRRWVDSPHSPSSQIIPILHKELMAGSQTYQEKGISPLPTGTYRKEHVRLDEKPINFFVNGLDVIPVMGKFTQDLDTSLDNLPRNPVGYMETIVEQAAKYYYTFEKIHPFLDGNGRVGRMILKRVLMGGGLKDLIFMSNLGHGRDEHLEAIQTVDKTGNIAYLELYLLKQLSFRYLGQKDKNILSDINRTAQKKTEQIKKQRSVKPLTSIWDGFEGLDLV